MGSFYCRTFNGDDAGMCELFYLRDVLDVPVGKVIEGPGQVIGLGGACEQGEGPEGEEVVRIPVLADLLAVDEQAEAPLISPDTEPVGRAGSGVDGAGCGPIDVIGRAAIDGMPAETVGPIAGN